MYIIIGVYLLYPQDHENYVLKITHYDIESDVVFQKNNCVNI